MNAHRSALDHVMTLVADSDWAHRLVLRGSMTMPAWVGAAARPPGDLDWVLRAPDLVPLDDLHPYPYFDSLAPVQQWPEAAHGAARNEMWEFEEFDADGRHPRLPPEGLHWIPAAALDDLHHEEWEDAFATLIEQDPRTPAGIEFHPDKITSSAEWDYADDTEYDDLAPASGGRVRLGLPWWSPDGEEGTVQVDVSAGEVLPDAPVCTAVPRFGDLPPIGLWTATRELSLAWKLHWLARDQHTRRTSSMKDLYDAVLLAELDGMHLRPRLRRFVLGAEALDAPAVQPFLAPAEIRRWTISGTVFGGDDPAPWLARLAGAVRELL